MIIVRESTSGVYFGQPRGIETQPDGKRRAFDTQVYTEDEISRVAAVAFELARERRGKVHSVEKANVMETGVLWRQVVTELHAEKYSVVTLEHMYADNRSEEHASELQSLMRISYAVFCLKKNNSNTDTD